MKAEGFSHLNSQGDVHMVDVGAKLPTERVAVATGRIHLSPATLVALQAQSVPKGNVLTTAKLAGIMAAKRTSELIPLCHPLSLTHVDLDFVVEETGIKILATTRTRDRTGVEMEALTAVAIAGLTIFDMCKALDKNMVIGDIQVLAKQGGKADFGEFHP